KGPSLRVGNGTMGERVKREVVGHRAFFRGGGDINRGACRQGDVNISGMVGERIFATVAEVAVISDVTVGGVDCNHSPVGVFQGDGTAHGDHFKVAMSDVLEANRP